MITKAKFRIKYSPGLKKWCYTGIGLSPPVKYFTDHSKALLLSWIFCVCSVLCLLCLCARLFICALWSPAGKGLTSWLSFVVSTVSLSLSYWYPGSGVVLDCIDS